MPPRHWCCMCDVDVLGPPTIRHIKAANNVINELHRTKDVFLRILPIPADDGIFMSISDALLANDDERSQGGYIRLHHQLFGPRDHGELEW